MGRCEILYQLEMSFIGCQLVVKFTFEVVHLPTVFLVEGVHLHFDVRNFSQSVRLYACGWKGGWEVRVVFDLLHFFQRAQKLPWKFSRLCEIDQICIYCLFYFLYCLDIFGVVLVCISHIFSVHFLMEVVCLILLISFIYEEEQMLVQHHIKGESLVKMI